MLHFQNMNDNEVVYHIIYALNIINPQKMRQN